MAKKDSDTTSNSNKRQFQPPYEHSLLQIVNNLKNEPFLFVLGLAIILIGGFTVLATRFESPDLRLIIMVLGILAVIAIMGYYGQKIFQDLKQDVKNVKERVEETDSHIDRVERALELVRRHLETSFEVPYEQLKEATSAAPLITRAEIWEIAHRHRRENWRDHKELMELSIPIFTALVELDTRDEYHRYHAQLGYALKDRREPDWIGAEAELSKAIEIRDKRGERPGYVNYEFNRAICKIKLDEHFLMNNRSATTTKESILTDLSVAALNPDRLELIESISPFTDWIELNGISREEYLSEKYLPAKWK